jgi:methionyl aminopeptidase
MRVAGRVTARALAELVPCVRPGVSTKEIDALAERLIRQQGGEPAFLGYQGFGGSICTSINEEVVHGLPSPRRLKDGDLLKIDIGARVDGWHGDMACTLAVGRVSRQAQRLLEVTQQALQTGLHAVRPGAYVSDIGHAVQSFVERRGFSVVRALVGHGVGALLHEEPAVPNFGKPGRGALLKPGMVLALEPMVNAGTWEVRTKADGWTVVTADGKLSAHFEHTVAVTAGGHEVLTVDADDAAVAAV